MLLYSCGGNGTKSYKSYSFFFSLCKVFFPLWKDHGYCIGSGFRFYRIFLTLPRYPRKDAPAVVLVTDLVSRRTTLVLVSPPQQRGGRMENRSRMPLGMTAGSVAAVSCRRATVPGYPDTVIPSPDPSGAGSGPGPGLPLRNRGSLQPCASALRARSPRLGYPSSGYAGSLSGPPPCRAPVF
jgi:hypothetical protein